MYKKFAFLILLIIMPVYNVVSAFDWGLLNPVSDYYRAIDAYAKLGAESRAESLKFQKEEAAAIKNINEKIKSDLIKYSGAWFVGNAVGGLINGMQSKIDSNQYTKTVANAAVNALISNETNKIEKAKLLSIYDDFSEYNFLINTKQNLVLQNNLVSNIQYLISLRNFLAIYQSNKQAMQTAINENLTAAFNRNVIREAKITYAEFEPQFSALKAKLVQGEISKTEYDIENKALTQKYVSTVNATYPDTFKILVAIHNSNPTMTKYVSAHDLSYAVVLEAEKSLNKNLTKKQKMSIYAAALTNVVTSYKNSSEAIQDALTQGLLSKMVEIINIENPKSHLTQSNIWSHLSTNLDLIESKYPQIVAMVNAFGPGTESDYIPTNSSVIQQSIKLIRQSAAEDVSKGQTLTAKKYKAIVIAVSEFYYLAHDKYLYAVKHNLLKEAVDKAINSTKLITMTNTFNKNWNKYKMTDLSKAIKLNQEYNQNSDNLYKKYLDSTISNYQRKTKNITQTVNISIVKHTPEHTTNELALYNNEKASPDSKPNYTTVT